MARERETVITVVTPGLGEEAAAGGQACLVVIYGQNIGRRHFLERPELILGRSESATVQVDQESVSRQHCKMMTKAGRTIVYDLGSTNGTFVNNERVETAELRDGDYVRVGQTIFKYISGSNIEGKYHEEIYRLTTVDGLTQAFNKRYLLETLERELNRSLRYGRLLSLVMFDIDRFKRINDTHGHLAGDHVLRELAALIAQNIRREDIFARYGGEEFALVLPEIDAEGAEQVCEKLRSIVEEQQIIFDGKRIPVTVSLGIRSVAADERELNVTELIAAADAMLYRAKQLGRNRVCRERASA